MLSLKPNNNYTVYFKNCSSEKTRQRNEKDRCYITHTHVWNC